MKKTVGLFLIIAMMASFIGGCTSKKIESKVVELKEVHEAVKENLGEDYGPDSPIDFETLEDLTGIQESDVQSYIAESPMISMNIDTFIAIKAKEGKTDLVKEGLEKYRKYLVEESLQYPMNIAKVNAAKVAQYGDYLFFIMLGRYDDRDDATEEERLGFAKEEVQKTEDVIAKFFK